MIFSTGRHRNLDWCRGKDGPCRPRRLTTPSTHGVYIRIFSTSTGQWVSECDWARPVSPRAVSGEDSRSGISNHP